MKRMLKVVSIFFILWWILVCTEIFRAVRTEPAFIFSHLSLWPSPVAASPTGEAASPVPCALYTKFIENLLHLCGMTEGPQHPQLVCSELSCRRHHALTPSSSFEIYAFLDSSSVSFPNSLHLQPPRPFHLQQLLPSQGTVVTATLLTVSIHLSM